MAGDSLNETRIINIAQDWEELIYYEAKIGKDTRCECHQELKELDETILNANLLA